MLGKTNSFNTIFPSSTDALIRVMAPVGTVVTVSKGLITKTDSGHVYYDNYTVYGYYFVIHQDQFDPFNPWTITATLSSETETISVIVNAAGEYNFDIHYDTRPVFTYTGSYEVVDDADNNIETEREWRDNWKIRFLTSGTLRFSTLGTAIDGADLFLVGGGGSGGSGGGTNSTHHSGGGGGYTDTVILSNLLIDTDYPIVIGEGGVSITNQSYPGNDGGESSAFGYTASGGRGGCSYGSKPTGYSNGGSGGGRGASAGGTDGGNGGSATATDCLGQGTSTREFYPIDGVSTAKLYSTGGSGSSAANAANNTGNGGGGQNNNGSSSGKGGSGIVILRNARGI